MKRRLIFLILCPLALMLTTHRLPAPISEEEKPTPAPQEEAPKPSTKSKRKTRENSQTSKPAEATKPKEPSKPKERFAGTWSGSITEFVWGTFDLTLVINASGTSVVMQSKFGTENHAATCDGTTVTWRQGVFNEVVWTFSPNSDATAAVSANSPLGIHSNTTLRRTSTSTAVSQPVEKIPTAKPVPERPGFVYNPFDPTSRVFIDVRGKPSGSKLVDPKSGKTFIVP